MRCCYGLRATVFAAALCALVAGASVWLGFVGAAALSALLAALGWISYFHSERSVLNALGARPVSEVERPGLYRLARELARAARLPVPRLYVSPRRPAQHPDGRLQRPHGHRVLHRGAARALLTPAELRAVLAHELAHVARREVGVFSWSAGLASLLASCPLIAVLLHAATPPGREYGADIDSALLTGDPMALASALCKIDTAATSAARGGRGAHSPPPTT